MMPQPAAERMQLQDYLRCGLAAFTMLFFGTGFDLYGYEALSTPNPTLVNVVVAAACVLLVFFDLRRPLHMLRSPLLAWVLVYLGVTALWAITLGSRPGSDALPERLKAMFLLLTVMFLVDDARARTVAAYAMAGAVLVLTVANVLDLLGVVTFAKGLLEVYAKQRVEGRASGFIYNSNEAGRAVVFAAAAAFWGVKRSWRLPLLVVAAVGVTTTFSRGTMMAFALFCAWVLWRRAVGGWRTLALALVAIVAGGWWMMTHAETVLSSVGAWNEDVQGRLRLSEWAKDDSGRGALLRAAWGAFLESPLQGHPFGEVELWQPHNNYVALALEHGVVGLLLLPGLALALFLSDRRQLTMAVLILLAGFFGHVLLLEHTILLALALAGAGAVATEEDAAREPEQPPDAPDLQPVS